MNHLRALLLTDVVDSTKLSQAIGDEAMATLWAAHDRAARDLLPAWRGREIDKTDGMLMLFDAAATTRLLGWRTASVPARAWCRYSASAASARHGW